MSRMLQGVSTALLLSACAFSGDWPDYRGPRRDGASPEKGLPEKWSPAGENLAWKAPVGGRSAPVAFGNRVFLFTTKGKGATLQERIVCLDGDSGKTLWEHASNVYLSDVPPHRAAWSSPAVDPETGNVYAFGVGGVLIAVTRDGKSLWERSLVEDFGVVTTHGGRTVSPVVDGDLVIVSSVTTGWGAQARAQHRFLAFDKRTGECMWVSTPGGRPFDTTYSPPVIAALGGVRMFIAGGGDGTVHAIKAQTGEPLWKYYMSKRGVNTGVGINGTTVFVSHSEENLDTSEMGLLAAIDGTARGDIGKAQIKWAKPGFQGGFSSPIVDGDRLYQIDNGAGLFAFDVVSGKQLWTRKLGTIQKSSPVLADGKLYVGTENGKFFILRLHQDRCEVVDEDLLGTEAVPEPIIASAAVSDGRVFVVSGEATYCIGRKKKGESWPVPRPDNAPPGAPVAHVQVVPAELALKPGDSVQFRARLFDSAGRFIREDKAEWAAAGAKGAIGAGGRFVAAADTVPSLGEVKATVAGVSGAARLRIIPPLPISQDFEGVPVKAVPPHWINTAGKYEVRDKEGGGKMLVKLADNPFTKRARSFIGHSDWSNYTTEADVYAVEKRRQMGDAGVVAQRYQLTLFGNLQTLELQPWQPETQRTVVVPFAWKANTWYRMKLRVEPTADGKVRARGKAWPSAEAEPADWLIDRVDPIPNRQGSPGIYADAPFEVFFDNIKVTSNQ